MTDITPEQRAALTHVREWLGYADRNDKLDQSVSALLDLLPAELTNPQPELPTEAGIYLDKEGDEWRLEKGEWIALWVGDVWERNRQNPAEYAPFTRLVPERPTITRDDVRAALIRHTYDEQVDAILALVSSKGAES